jgi:hypothetical protein
MIEKIFGWNGQQLGVHLALRADGLEVAHDVSINHKVYQILSHIKLLSIALLKNFCIDSSFVAIFTLSSAMPINLMCLISTTTPFNPMLSPFRMF